MSRVRIKMSYSKMKWNQHLKDWQQIIKRRGYERIRVLVASRRWCVSTVP